MDRSVKLDYTTPRHATKANRRQTGTYMGYVAALPVDMQSKLQYNRAVYHKHTHALRWLESYGRQILRKREVRVLSFLFSRTLLFGKTAERILATHFQHGVFNEKTGECITARWGGNNSDWYAAVKILEQRGFIVVHPVNAGGRTLGTIYEIAIDCILNTTPCEDDMSALREPKRLRNKNNEPQTAEVIDFGAARLQKKGELGCSLSTTCVPFLRVRKGTRELSKLVEEENSKLPEPRSSARDEVVEQPRITRTARVAINCNPGEAIRKAVSAATAKSSSALREKVIKDVVGSSICMGDLVSTWKQAVMDVAGKTPVVGLSRAEYARFKCTIKTYSITFSWYDFFYWCAANWSALNTKYERSTRGRNTPVLNKEEGVYLGTPYPCISRMVRHLAKLIRAYNDATVSMPLASGPKDSDAELRKLQEALSAARREALMYKEQAQAARKEAIASAASNRAITVRPPARRTQDPWGGPEEFEDSCLGEWEE